LEIACAIFAFFGKIDIFDVKIGILDIYGCLKTKDFVKCHFPDFEISIN